MTKTHAHGLHTLALLFDLLFRGFQCTRRRNRADTKTKGLCEREVSDGWRKWSLSYRCCSSISRIICSCRRMSCRGVRERGVVNKNGMNYNKNHRNPSIHSFIHSFSFIYKKHLSDLSTSRACKHTFINAHILYICANIHACMHTHILFGILQLALLFLADCSIGSPGGHVRYQGRIGGQL